MDDTSRAEPREFSSPLLSTELQAYHGNHGVECEDKRQKETWSVPAILILTTLVAVSGSYVFGSAVSSHSHFFLLWQYCKNLEVPLSQYEFCRWDIRLLLKRESWMISISAWLRFEL